MTKQIEVRFLPDQPGPNLNGACVIMTDVLRASSTIATALANGASSIVPRAEIAESLAVARDLGDGALIGGERNGQIIEGFQLGNSPLEYRTDVVGDRPIVLCTTNGTWALEYCRGAAKIVIGALVNLGAVVDVAIEFDRVVVVCAGTNRKVTGEDVLFAGGVVDRIASQIVGRGGSVDVDRNGRVALAVWRDVDRCGLDGDVFDCSSKSAAEGDVVRGSRSAMESQSNREIQSNAVNRLKVESQSIFEFFKTCRGGRNLFRMGYVADLEYCAVVDSVLVVPVLDEASWSIGVG